MKSILWCSVALIPGMLLSSDELPPHISAFFESHCYECHAGDDAFVEGDFNLETASMDWLEEGTVGYWTRVFEVIQSNDMPPKDAESFPSEVERELLLSWLGNNLTQHGPVGGTLPRRLNRVEYENTIRVLFDYPEFVLPPSFPSDDSNHGFDNLASGLVLSPPLLAQYLEIATHIADEFLPQPTSLAKAKPQNYPIRPSEFSTPAGGGAALAQDAYRLVSSRNMASAAGWTTSFEVPISGIYHVKIEVQTFQSDNMFYEWRKHPFRLEVYAKPNGEKNYVQIRELRTLGAFDIPVESDSASDYELEAELFQGEVLGFRWADGPVYSDPGLRDISHAFIDDRLLNDRQFYAAAIKLNGGKRGSTQVEFYEAIRSLIESGELDLSDPQLDKPPTVYGGGLSNAPHNWSLNYAREEMHRFGPALDIWGATIEGPIRVVSDQQTRARLARSKKLLGPRSNLESDIDFAERVLRVFLSKAFRRPVSEIQLHDFMDLVRAHRADYPNKRIEDALHLALRRALISPYFLFRCINSGDLDEWDLASRLSYFLNNTPPDDQLVALASKGVLSNPVHLANETRRLLAKNERQEFVRHFTGQWLGTRMLKEIMPDSRLLNFFDIDRDAMISETELFFEEIIVENLTLDHFIDPGFSFRNRNLNKIYGGDLAEGEMQRVTFEKGGSQGGLLGLASIMMATANGVDTHPVHRGVWLLENVLGQATPPPPPDVAAIAPDTSGTTTMREQMMAHQADKACARCHEKIDPLGFVMENFDPVGRWRDYYPVYTEASSAPLKQEFYSNLGEGTRVGRRIDSSAKMPDGTLLANVTDLKMYLLENMNLFSECLVEKLLMYGTGRTLSFGDRRIARELAVHHMESRDGFQDLMVAVVLSESFLSR